MSNKSKLTEKALNDKSVAFEAITPTATLNPGAPLSRNPTNQLDNLFTKIFTTVQELGEEAHYKEIF